MVIAQDRLPKPLDPYQSAKQSNYNFTPNLADFPRDRTEV